MKDVVHQSTQEWLADYEGQDSVASITQLRDHSTTKPKSAIKRNQRQSLPKTHPHKIIVPDGPDVLIPEGKYVARCYDYKFSEFKGTKKIIFKFEISQGCYTGTRLECFYNLDWQKSKAGEYTLKPANRGFYMRLMKGLFEETSSGGPEWLSPDILVGKQFSVEVVTVTHDQNRTSLGRNQYMKIKPILELFHA